MTQSNRPNAGPSPREQAATTTHNRSNADHAPRKQAAARTRGRFGGGSAVWLILAGLYFVLPLIGVGAFSVQGAHGLTLDYYNQILSDPNFQSSILLSAQIAVAAVALSLILMTPTVFWINLRLPHIRPFMDFIGVLPFVVPPVTLGVGVIGVFQGFPWMLSGPHILVFIYVVLALPFTYRSLDAGFQAIPLKTLTEAGQSLGASWAYILWRVVAPNIRVSIISAAFLSLTLVMGEYTIAAFLSFNTFGTYIYQIGVEQANGAAALSVLSLLLTWATMFGILFLGRGSRGQQGQIGGAR